MQTKLTLRMEDQLIDQAKRYAVTAGKSLSQVVADYFKYLGKEKTEQISKPAPITNSLRGLLQNSKIDENDYKKYLEEKYR